MIGHLDSWDFIFLMLRLVNIEYRISMLEFLLWKSSWELTQHHRLLERETQQRRDWPPSLCKAQGIKRDWRHQIDNKDQDFIIMTSVWHCLLNTSWHLIERCPDCTSIESSPVFGGYWEICRLLILWANIQVQQSAINILLAVSEFDEEPGRELPYCYCWFVEI